MQQWPVWNLTKVDRRNTNIICNNLKFKTLDNHISIKNNFNTRQRFCYDVIFFISNYGPQLPKLWLLWQSWVITKNLPVVITELFLKKSQHFRSISSLLKKLAPSQIQGSLLDWKVTIN